MYSYDVIDVEHGGTIEGTIILDGVVPEPKGFNLITFPDPMYCGRISNGRGWRLLHDFVVSRQGGLKDAIVLLEGIEAGKPFDVSVPLIEARDCMFYPFMTIVRNGHAVEVINMDLLTINIRAMRRRRRLVRAYHPDASHHEPSASSRATCTPCIIMRQVSP